jgi:hypothetical protein
MKEGIENLWKALSLKSTINFLDKLIKPQKQTFYQLQKSKKKLNKSKKKSTKVITNSQKSKNLRKGFN